jgi:hypothetical protein
MAATYQRAAVLAALMLANPAEPLKVLNEYVRVVSIVVLCVGDAASCARCTFVRHFPVGLRLSTRIAASSCHEQLPRKLELLEC